jgi:HEAT repeat protein
MGAMSLLLTLLLLAPEPVAVKVPEIPPLLKGKKPKTDAALALLKEIGQLKGNDAEAKALVKLIKSSKVKKPPEIMEASFLALKGIGSRKVTKSMILLLNVNKLKKDPVVRIGICRALEGSADPAGIEHLTDSLRDVDDRVIAAAAAALGVHRHAKVTVRKDLFESLLKVYVPTWNLKNSVKQDLKVQRRRAERKWEVIEAPMEKSLALLSNVTQPDPPSWQRWWNKNKKKRWQAIEH